MTHSEAEVQVDGLSDHSISPTIEQMEGQGGDGVGRQMMLVHEFVIDEAIRRTRV